MGIPTPPTLPPGEDPGAIIPLNRHCGSRTGPRIRSGGNPVVVVGGANCRFRLAVKRSSRRLFREAPPPAAARRKPCRNPLKYKRFFRSHAASAWLTYVTQDWRSAPSFLYAPPAQRMFLLPPLHPLRSLQAGSDPPLLTASPSPRARPFFYNLLLPLEKCMAGMPASLLPTGSVEYIKPMSLRRAPFSSSLRTPHRDTEPWVFSSSLDPGSPGSVLLLRTLPYSIWLRPYQ